MAKLRHKKELEQRWTTEQGENIYKTILKHINEGEAGRDIIEVALKQLLYSEELPVHKARNGKTFQLSDFRGIDFTSCNLSGADLGYGQYDYAKFEKCDLNNVNIFSANIKNASMSEVQGTKAWIHGVLLDNVNLDNAHFQDTEFNIKPYCTTFKKAYFKGCTMVCLKSNNVNFEGATFDNSSLSLQNSWLADNENGLEEGNTSWINLKSTVFKNSSELGTIGKWHTMYFDESKLFDIDFSGYAIQGPNPLQNASFQKAILKRVNFSGANLEGSNFENAYLEEVNFENATLENVNFRGTNLQNANFQGANVQGADFTGANTKGANFIGAEF